METDYIAEFIKIAQVKSFSQAAEELYISQSTLSKHIKALETTLGVQLFDRTTRRVKLTSFGQHILVLSEQIVENSRKIHQMAQTQQTRNRNHLLITSIPVMAQYNITGSIATFLKEHTDIHLTFSENESFVIKKLLENGDFELAFTRIIDQKDPALEYLPFYQDTLVAVLPKKHPLANRKRIDLKELVDEKFIFLDENTLLYDYLNDLCRKSGFHPHIIQTAHRPENIIDLVSKDFGISLLYRRQSDYVNNPNTVAIDITPESTSLIALTKLKSHTLSYAASSFWKHIEKVKGLPKI
jgi:LysR family transcriptional regulator, transcription activator of glutamate synthase operon